MPQTVLRAEADVFGDTALRKKVRGKNLALYKSETAHGPYTEVDKGHVNTSKTPEQVESQLKNIRERIESARGTNDYYRLKNLATRAESAAAAYKKWNELGEIGAKANSNG